MFGILEAVAVPHTAIYSSYEELMQNLNDRVSKEGYKIVKARSHRGRTGGAELPGNEMVRCDLVCDRGGRPYKCMATKHKTTTKKTGCPWKAKAVHRKTVGGWVLTISCDQHNHEPGTPEPPTPDEVSEVEDSVDAEGKLQSRIASPALTSSADPGPQPDPETSAAMQVAGVSNAVLRLTGDTFQQFKTEYRKMSQPERLGILSQLQLRIAAIYAVQNEDMQRTQRQDALQKRHEEIDAQRRQRKQQKAQRRQHHPQQHQPQQPQQPQQQPQPQHDHSQLGTPQPMHMQPQQMHTQHMAAQNHQQMNHQQFHLPDSPSQQLMTMGMNLSLPSQAPPQHQQQFPQAPAPNQRRRVNRPSQNGTPQPGQ